jgi:fermentation-respiration switch protein FrsA (DUF1100 family)
MSESAKARPSGWTRWSCRILRMTFLVYLGLCAGCAMLQDRMIFPGRSTQGTLAAHVASVPGQELLRLRTANGETIAVLFGPAQLPNGLPRPDAAARPTLLYFYGNASSISYSLQEFSDFRRIGCNVAVAEFVGYGLSSGKAGEDAIYRTANTAYEALLSRKDIDPHQIIPVGRSLGATAAIHLASTKPVAGLVTLSAFTSMHDMGRQILPWFPTGLFEKYRFDNLRKMEQVKCPVFLAHGTMDDLVPYAMNARLIAAARGRVTAVPVEGADHNDIYVVGGKKLLAKLGAFVDDIHQAATQHPEATGVQLAPAGR